MTRNTRILTALLVGAALPMLAGCGANDIASPGTGGNVTINYPTPTPSPTPTPTPTPTSVTPAAACPTLPTGANAITPRGTTGATPTGEWRICELPSVINQSVTLPKVAGLIYTLPGRVDVGCDRGPDEGSVPSTCTIASATLNIEPGVIIAGSTGVSWLAVNRGNKINAVGTATQPIIFTSMQNVMGTNNQQSSGQWGGVVLLGRAPITDCTNAATPGTANCYRQTEGSVDPAYYGGATTTDSSGRMSYVQIRYSGYVFANNSELQALTPSGIGSGTVLDHIQSYNSSDDGVEFFGGVANMKHLIVVGAEDDSLDTDVGLKGQFQYVLAIQRAGANIGDSIIEADSDNAFDANTPRQNVEIANATFIQRSSSGSNGTAILLRGGTDYTIVNSVLVSSSLNCLRISRAQTASTTVDASIDEAGAPVFRSFVMQCPSGNAFSGANTVTAAQVQAIFEAGSNNSSTFSPSLASLFINGSAETQVSPFDASTISSFFDRTNYIGAVRDANDTWYAGWTCNSDSATFDSASNGNRACTSLPVT